MLWSVLLKFNTHTYVYHMQGRQQRGQRGQMTPWIGNFSLFLSYKCTKIRSLTPWKSKIYSLTRPGKNTGDARHDHMQFCRSILPLVITTPYTMTSELQTGETESKNALVHVCRKCWIATGDAHYFSLLRYCSTYHRIYCFISQGAIWKLSWHKFSLRVEESSIIFIFQGWVNSTSHHDDRSKRKRSRLKSEIDVIILESCGSLH